MMMVKVPLVELSVGLKLESVRKSEDSSNSRNYKLLIFHQPIRFQRIHAEHPPKAFE